MNIKRTCQSKNHKDKTNRQGNIQMHRGAALLAALNGFDEEFVSQLEQNSRQQPAMQDREAV
jgi:hypothetical protein